MVDIVANVPMVPTPVKQVENWLQKHERLIIVVLVLLVGMWGYNKWINNSADKADAKLVVATQQLTAAQQEVSTLKAKAEADAVAWDAMLRDLDAKSAALDATVAQRNAALKQLQGQVKEFQPSEMTVEWRKLINAAPTDVTVTSAVDSSGTSVPTYHVSGEAAVNTVNQLEALPVTQKNFADTQDQLINTQNAVDTCNKVVVDLRNEISGLVVQSTAQDTHCKAQVAAVKADARRSKRNWFIKGLVVGAGIVGYLALHY